MTIYTEDSEISKTLYSQDNNISWWFLLKEDSFNLLLENGWKIILNWGWKTTYNEISSPDKTIYTE